MTNSEIVAAIISGISTIATALAVLAAFRSARSASDAQRALIDGQLSAGRHEVAQLVSSCATEYRRIQFLARTLRILDRTLAMFNGALGGSVQARTEAGIVKLLDSAEDSFKSAAAFSDDPVAVGKLISEDVDRLRVELTMRLGVLRSIGDELMRESESRECQVLQHRAQSLSTGVVGALRPG